MHYEDEFSSSTESDVGDDGSEAGQLYAHYNNDPSLLGNNAGDGFQEDHLDREDIAGAISTSTIRRTITKSCNAMVRHMPPFFHQTPLQHTVFLVGNPRVRENHPDKTHEARMVKC